MPRWLWFAPLGILVVGLGVLGFRLGWATVTLSETDVIKKWATHYLNSAGENAAAHHCEARPGSQEDFWIVVTCIASSGARFDYPVDRAGRLVEIADRRAREPRT